MPKKIKGIVWTKQRRENHATIMREHWSQKRAQKGIAKQKNETAKSRPVDMDAVRRTGNGRPTNSEVEDQSGMDLSDVPTFLLKGGSPRLTFEEVETLIQSEIDRLIYEKSALYALLMRLKLRYER